MKASILRAIIQLTPLAFPLKYAHAEDVAFLYHPRIGVVSSHGSERTVSKVSTNNIKWEDYTKEILHALGGDDVVAFFGFNPNLKVRISPDLNAHAIGPDKIIISSGLLGLIQNVDEYAFVLAHELGHIVLHHQNGGNLIARCDLPRSSLEREIEADQYAIRLLSEAGFSTQAGVNLLKKLGDFGTTEGFSLSTAYPTLEPRRTALEKLVSTFQVPELLALSQN